MPVPSQTFANMQQLLNYINSLIVTNGMNEISGEETNNVVNALANFIVSYGVNTQLAGISSSTGVVSLSKPITIFTVVPTSVQWPDNVQFEYYIVNATGQNLPLTAGYSYVDQYGVSQTIIPLRSAIHIAKASNGTWFQVNNLPGNSGGGGLPPQSGNAGKFLQTNGVSDQWFNPVIQITSNDFNLDGYTYSNPALDGMGLVVQWDDIPRMLYYNPPNITFPSSDWIYAVGGGIQVLIPGFDTVNNFRRLTLWVKGLN